LVLAHQNSLVLLRVKQHKLEAEGQYEGLRNNARSFLNFIYNDQWSEEARGVADPALLGRSAYWDSIMRRQV